LKMSDLEDAFAAAGCKQVKTYIQSGNVIFDAPARGATAIIRRIQTKLTKLLLSEATVVFRTVRELEKVVNRDPFRELKADGTVKLYVTFLSRKPSRKPKLPLVLPKERLEVIHMKNLEVFIVSRRKNNGMYGFPNNFIEKELGVKGTTRNWSTITKLVQLAMANPEPSPTRATTACAG